MDYPHLMESSIKFAKIEGHASAREVLARNIRSLRAAHGWSQEALALEAGLHRTFVAHVERGARNISLSNIERIAIALQVPVSRLFET